LSLLATNIAGDQGLYSPVLLPPARRLKPNRMTPDYTDYYQWEWREVARHAASLHSGWELRGYVTRRPDGWYAIADNPGDGLLHRYSLKGLPQAQGPYPTAEAAEQAARALIDSPANGSTEDRTTSLWT
jgi:hypothetical protein